MSDDARRVRAALADPLDVARRLGLLDGAKRQPRGGLMVRCPNGHDKRAPSCSLTIGPDATLRARCFGCGLAGDAFTLVAACEGLDARRDFRAVFLRATELAGVEASGPETSRGRPRDLSPRRAPAPAGLDAARFGAIARVVLAAGSLDAPSSADVVRYLDGRGLLALARADGWAALPRLDALNVDAAELRASGLALPSGEEWAHAAHRLCVPWRGLDGSIVSLQRRRIDSAPGDRYVVPSGRAPSMPYGADALAAAPADAPIVIVEGAADVLAARALARSSPVVLGLPGVEGWRPSWAKLGRGRRVLVGLDADAAGDRAAVVLARDLAAAGASHVERVRPPGGAQDWSDALAARSIRAA